tara:strand:- start:9887 stop:10282 length:396 start_codon:yes stop_codon:yes gene_type:complete
MTTLKENDLNQFIGDLVRYRHPLNRKVIYTPGVRHVAEAGEAYWLIDAIASWYGSDAFNEAAAKDDRINDWHTWTLTVGEDNAATLRAKADSPDDAFIVQTIPFTDFPLSSIDICAGNDGEHWTLYLPSEH